MILTVDDDFFIDDDGYIVVCDGSHTIRLQPATDEDVEVYEAKCQLVYLKTFERLSIDNTS